MKKSINILMLVITIFLAIITGGGAAYFNSPALLILSAFCVGAGVILAIGALCEHISEQLQ
jgi:hypothetical protein